MKKRFVKLLGLLLAVVMLMGVMAACGGGDESEPADTEPTPVPTEAADKAEPTATPVPTEPPKDLGGKTIVIGDWWSTAEEEPKTQKDEDTLAYRKEFMEKYNFNIERKNLGTWGEYQEIMVTSTMSNNPAADIFFMYFSFVASPLQQGLLYQLDTLENFNFDDPKWNQVVREIMTMDGHTYGMANGRMEPRLGVFWNKRLFKEAGLDPDLPYDMQKNGEWTWEALEELARINTRDTNNDGTPDVYGIASFSKDFFRGCVFSNDAKFIGYENGKFYNATNEPNFLEALQWGYSLYEKGYHMPQPEGSNWDWFVAAFAEGKVAMQCGEVWRNNNWKEMEDDYGFVIFPKGPKGEMMTVFTENVVVMPSTHSKEHAEDCAFAYDLYTNPTPGYEDDDWQSGYYEQFRDTRAVEETLPLFYEPNHGVISYLGMISGIDYGDVTYDLDAGALTAAESVEKVQQLWQAHIDEANGVETEEETAE